MSYECTRLGISSNQRKAGTAQKERKHLTSEMSHERSGRAASITIYVLKFHFEIREVARGVTDPAVGSGALLGGGA